MFNTNDTPVFIDRDGGMYVRGSDERSYLSSSNIENQEIITEESDFERNSNREYQLKDNTVYRIVGIVTPSLPIRLGNNTPIVGNHGSTDGLVHTGGQDLFRGTDKGLFLKDLYGHAPGGTLFNISGDSTTEILVESCSFSDAAGLGNMASLGTIDGFRVPSFKGCNFENFDGGLTFAGSSSAPDKIFIESSPFREVSTSNVTTLTFSSAIGPEVVDIVNCYFKGFQSDTEVVRVESGATPTEVFQYRGNTHDSSVTRSNILTGVAGEDSIGYKVRDSGPLRDSTVVGDFGLLNNSTTTFSSTDNFKPINGANTTRKSVRVSLAGDASAQYDGRVNERVKVFFSGVLRGANGDSYQVRIEKNGSTETGSTVEGTGITKEVNIVTSAVVDVSTGDQITMTVANLDNTNDVEFVTYNFLVHKI